jgi:hypothetical protein
MPADQPSNCIDEGENLLAAGVINTLTDFIVALLLIPIVWNLQLPMGRRMKAISLLRVGILVCAAQKLCGRPIRQSLRAHTMSRGRSDLRLLRVRLS